MEPSTMGHTRESALQQSVDALPAVQPALCRMLGHREQRCRSLAAAAQGRGRSALGHLPALEQVVVDDHVIGGGEGGEGAVGALEVLVHRVRAPQVPELVGAAEMHMHAVDGQAQQHGCDAQVMFPVATENSRQVVHDLSSIRACLTRLRPSSGWEWSMTTLSFICARLLSSRTNI